MQEQAFDSNGLLEVRLTVGNPKSIEAMLQSNARLLFLHGGRRISKPIDAS